MAQIRAQTHDGDDLIAFMLWVFRGKVKKARLEDRMAAATWLADRRFGKPLQVQHISSEDQVRESLVTIYIPDNGRDGEALSVAPIPPGDT